MNGADKSTYRSVSGTSGVTTTRRGLSPACLGTQTYETKTKSTSSPEITVFTLTRRTSLAATSMQVLYGFGSPAAEIGARYSNASTFRYEIVDKFGMRQTNGILSGLADGIELNSCIVISSPRNSSKTFNDGMLVTSAAIGGLTNLVYEAATSLTIGDGFVGSVPLLLIFSRALSDAEVKSLSANPWQIFAPDSKALWTPADASVSLPTLVQPSSTTSAGAWTATGAATLHDAINELVPSDTQYISVNSASTTELLLAEAAYPGAANQTLAYRASSTQGSTLTVTLRQGVTTIMTRTHALTGTDTLYTQTLTAPEIALITSGAISVTLTTS